MLEKPRLSEQIPNPQNLERRKPKPEANLYANEQANADLAYQNRQKVDAEQEIAAKKKEELNRQKEIAQMQAKIATMAGNRQIQGRYNSAADILQKQGARGQERERGAQTQLETKRQELTSLVDQINKGNFGFTINEDGSVVEPLTGVLRRFSDESKRMRNKFELLTRDIERIEAEIGKLKTAA